MFSLFPRPRSLRDVRALRGTTDWHSHLLPGVDDGVQTLEETLSILTLYEQLGVSQVWLTPHIMEDIPNTTAALRQRYSELTAAYGGTITLRLAAENMLDNLFDERLARRDLLPLGESADRLLVETSYFNPPMDMDRTLKRIQSQGYHVVLAHPERYYYMDKPDYRRLKAMGIHFQVNLPSLAGAYGPDVRRKAEWLFDQSMVSLTGTDTHSLRMLTRALDVKTPWIARHLKPAAKP